MDVFFEILKYTLPAILVIVVVYLMLNKLFKAEESRRRFQLFKETQKTTTPIRFTAYERLVLFLERISPDSMLIRVQDNTLTALQFQRTLLMTVRTEYEHNLAQQIYVSDDAWQIVRNAKESIVQLINTCASQIDPQAPSIELAKVILATYDGAPSSPTLLAINVLKKELSKQFS